MNQSDIDTIRASAHKFSADKFYETLFRNHPELQPAFPNLNRQKAALSAALGRVLNALDNLTGASPFLRQLGKRHVGYGATTALYEAVGLSLIESLELQGVDQVGAWLNLYTFISDEMQAGANAV